MLQLVKKKKHWFQKKINKVFVPLFLWIGITSCIPDPLVLEEVPSVRPEIVVATQMVGSRSVLVSLTKTFSALEVGVDKEPEEFLRKLAINDASITISGPRGGDSLSFEENGIYLGENLSLQAGETYELLVVSEEIGTVTATTTVQPQVDFTNVSADLYYEGLDDTLAVVSYEFDDPRETNWYMVNIQKVGEANLTNFVNPEAYTLLFEDEEFNGEQYKESYTFFPDGYVPGDTVLVSLSNISQDYFQFMKLRTEDRLSFLEFLSEPANYPSNVTGGKGFFNLYFPDVRVIAFERQL